MSTEVFERARRHLSRRDAVLRLLIRRVGPCTLKPHTDLFALLVRSIISQQISTRAADSIGARLIAGPCGGTLSASAIINASDDALREAGLSAAKRRSLKDLAQRVQSGGLPLDRLAAMGDEEVIAALVPVHGIGRWTAQMFLIFALCRLDILPVDDFGLRNAVRQQYGLDELPDRKKVEEVGEPWRPYCSIATWYLWRSLDAR